LLSIFIIYCSLNVSSAIPVIVKKVINKYAALVQPFQINKLFSAVINQKIKYQIPKLNTNDSNSIPNIFNALIINNFNKSLLMMKLLIHRLLCHHTSHYLTRKNRGPSPFLSFDKFHLQLTHLAHPIQGPLL